MTPENLIKRQICIYLRKKKDLFFWVNDSVGIFDPVRKVYRRNNDPFRIKGVSDILGILRTGVFLAIEVKSEKGKASLEQLNFINKINRAGGLAFIARSVEDVKKHLTEWEQKNESASDGSVQQVVESQQ